MATASSAQSGPNLSNGSIGTRLGSASDWIRMKRIRAVRDLPTQQVTHETEKWKNTTPQLPHGKSLLIPKEIGPSKIQRPASRWVDYKAAQSADFVTAGRSGTDTTSVKLIKERICDCSTSTLNPRLTSCQKCSVKRWYTPRI